MRVALIFDKWRADTIGIYFEKAFSQLGVDFDHWWLKDTDKMPADYDLYVRIDHGDYRLDLPQHFHPAVFYAIDTHLDHSWKKIRRSVGAYDMVYFCHRDATEKIKGSRWLPVAFDPELMQQQSVDVANESLDIAFVGNDGGIPRKFVLQALRERYPRHYIGHARAKQLLSWYRAAKIGFNFSIRNEINMRMFEILGSGTLLATNSVPQQDLEILELRENEHFIGYPETDELYTVLDHWLAPAMESERLRIAANGRQWALAGHTYRHRAMRILQDSENNFGLSFADNLKCTTSSSNAGEKS